MTAMDHVRELWWICVAGFSGALTSISIHRDKRSPLEVVIFIVSGMLTATFVAPLLAKWMNLTGNEAISAVGFLTGACWNSVISRAMTWFNSVRVPGETKASNGGQ